MDGDLERQSQARKLAAARHFMRTHQYARAVAEAREYLAGEPNSAEGHMVLMAALIDGERWGEANGEWRELLRVAPEEARAHYLVALMHGRQAEWGRARLHVNDSLKLNPNDADAWGLKAQGQYARGHRERAKASLRKALELAPYAVTYQVLLARYEMPVKPEKEDAEYTVKRIQQHMAGDAENDYAWRTLTRLYSDPLKNWREAEAAARVVLRKDPGDAEMQALLFGALRHQRWEYQALMFPRRVVMGYAQRMLVNRGPRIALIAAVLVIGGGWGGVWALLLGPLALYFSCCWPLEHWYKWITLRDIRGEAMQAERKATGWPRWWTPRVRAAALFPVPAVFVAGLFGWTGLGWMGGLVALLGVGAVILGGLWVRQEIIKARRMRRMENPQNLWVQGRKRRFIGETIALVLWLGALGGSIVLLSSSKEETAGHTAGVVLLVAWMLGLLALLIYERWKRRQEEAQE